MTNNLQEISFTIISYFIFDKYEIKKIPTQ